MRRLLVFLLFAASAAAQSQFGGNSGSVASPSLGTLASNYGVVGNGKMCQDATLTGASAVITSAGQCAWTQADVGSIGWVTNVCNVGQCGFVNFPTAITVMPSTQTKVFRIASVQSATQITVDCTAPGNCVSPFPSNAGNAGHNTVLWAPDGTGANTTALNNAWAASFPTNGCGALILPTGLIFFNSALFTQLPAGSNCTWGNGQGPGIIGFIGAAAYEGGPSVAGKGTGSTILVPRPDFNWSSCSGTVPAIGGFYSLELKDLAVNGYGQSLLSSGLPNTCIALTGSPLAYFHNVNFSGWANSTIAATDGVEFGGAGGYSVASNVVVIGFGGGGGAACRSAGDNNIIINSACIGAGAQNSFRNSATILQTSNMQFGPSSRQNTTAMLNDVGALWQDVAGRCEGDGPAYGQTVPTSVITNNGTMFLTNFANGCNQPAGASIGITNSATGVMNITQYKPYQGRSWTTGLANAGTINDIGGTSYGGPITGAGTIIADGHSVKGICTGTVTASSTLGLYNTGPNVTATTCTSTNIGTGVPVSGVRTLAGLSCIASAAGNTASDVCIVLQNGANVGSCSLNAVAACNVGLAVALVDGDRISIEITSGVASTLANVKAIAIWN